ncbi:UNVERIFIED_CONTAM: protein DJ-1B [Sesamum radiatum]|uniref:Protein DJ-1B n=1 Tax=Sesamum radiatum TaxID=300843 RepID=A0AAW2K343_SESRA
MEAVIIIDVLRRAKAEVVVASVEDKLEILASRKVKLVADVLLDEAANRSYDLIVLPVRGAITEVLLFFTLKHIVV